MKNIQYILVFFLSFLLLQFCKTTDKESVPLNTEVIIDGEPMLVGLIDRAGYALPEYKSWFDSTYNAFVIDTIVTDSLAHLLDNISLKVILGTWCSDSQREIPALFRILDYADYDYSGLEQFAVDREKIIPGDMTLKYKVDFVPIIMLYRDSLELGRITEMPEQSLEKDMLAILKRENRPLE
jgi:hypothetical protein